MPDKKNKPKKSVFREYLGAIGWAILIALLIRTWGVQAFQIPSGSMKPTLLVGDHLLVNKSRYGVHIPHEIDFGREGRASHNPSFSEEYAGRMIVEFSPPARGDIIVFRNPEDRAQDFIKRVIGLPGETVQVQGKTIFINGQAIEDSWGYFDNTPVANDRRRSLSFGPVVVPDKHYFVMGDNRDHSHDSRYWFGGGNYRVGPGGYVPEQDILGKALIIYFSWDSEGNDGVRWSRIASLIE